MPFYEVAYETGRVSVAFYENDAEAESALKAHNDRAKGGLAGGPVHSHPQGVTGEPNWPAERIAAVYKYDKHPNEFNAAQTMSADLLEKEVAGLIKRLSDDNGVVLIDQLAVEVRGLSHPIKSRAEAHDSVFRMKETEAMQLGFLDG